MGWASPIIRRLTPQRWVLIEHGYECGCVKSVRRPKATGTPLPVKCPDHPWARERWVRTTDVENIEDDDG